MVTIPVQGRGGVSPETSPSDSYDHSQPRQPRENCVPRCRICPQEQSVLIARGKGWSAATFATSDGMLGIASINMLNHHVNLPPCRRYEVLPGPYYSRGREELVGPVNRQSQVHQTSLAMFHVKHRVCLPSVGFTWNILHVETRRFHTRVVPRQSCFT